MAYISAISLQTNYQVFINGDYTVGLAITDLPTPASGAEIDGDYWAVPVTDGVVSGFNYTATNAASATAPDPQAFHVVRISLKIGGGPTFWYIIGTSAEYSSDSGGADCCSLNSPPHLPSALPSVYPCQEMCIQDSNNNYIAILGSPTLGGGQEYHALGLYNGSALPTQSDATLAGLLTLLNTNWSVVGTWTLSGTTFTATSAEGGSPPGTGVLCAAILAY